MWWRQDIVLWPLFNDPTLQHDNNIIGNGPHGGQVMGNEQIGDVNVILQALQKLENFFRHQLIQG